MRPRTLCSLLAIFVVYALFKAGNLSTAAADHWVYHYAAHLWSEGIVPHRDFFISHPPLQFVPNLGVILLFGANITALSLLPALLGAMSGVVLFVLVKKHSDDTTAMLATGFFLLSFSTLLSTLYSTGQNFAVLMLLLATLFFLDHKRWLAGCMMGIAVCIGAHTVMGMLAISLLALREGWKKLFPLVGGFIAVVVPVHLVFFAIAGNEFFQQVYWYHLQKPKGSSFLASKLTVFLQMAEGHGLILVLAISTLLFMASHKAWRTPLTVVSSMLAGGMAGFLLLMDPIFTHYFAPLVPFVAILAAVGLRKVRHPAFAIALVPLLLWSAERTFTFTRLEQQLLVFSTAQELADRVREDLEPHETLYGAFGVTQLISLLSERRTAAHEIDSSVMRFESGLYDLTAVIEKIEQDNVKAIISQSKKGIGSYPKFRPYLEKNFIPIKIYRSPGSATEIEYWRRAQR